jgi:hypothetical protein
MSKNPPIRPGLIIKKALERRPLGISELHREYKEQLEELNGLRSKQQRIHGCTYWSFARMCQFARALGLIEVDHEAPIEELHAEVLKTIRGNKVVPATRVIYRLTSAGRAEEEAWYNLSGSFSGAIKERQAPRKAPARRKRSSK